MKTTIYFAADKFGRIFIFDEKPSLMVDMERQNMFGYPQNSPYWVVEKKRNWSFWAFSYPIGFWNTIFTRIV